MEMVHSMVMSEMSQETARDCFHCLVSVVGLWFENALPKFLKRKFNLLSQLCLGGAQAVCGALTLSECLPPVGESSLCQA